MHRLYPALLAAVALTGAAAPPAALAAPPRPQPGADSVAEAAADPPPAPPASPATAPPAPPAAPAVDALVAEALARSPAIAALRAEAAARAAEEGAAAALPDPMVEAMLQNAGLAAWTVGDEEMSMLGAELRQELPYRGKRAAARRVAAAETARANARLVHLERQVIHDVRMLYAEIYAIDRELETLAAGAELVDLLEATVRGRYATGESGSAALLRAQLERTRVGEAIADRHTERAEKLAELNRWLDRPGDAPLGVVAELPRLRPEHDLAPLELDALAGSGSAEVALAAAAVDVAEAELATRVLDRRPDFAAAAGLGWRGDLDPVLTLRFGVSLPVWRRQKQDAQVAAALQRVAASQHELADARAMSRSEAAALHARFRNAEDQVRRYRDGIVPQSSAALDAARAAYLGGRGGFGEVVESYDLWLEARAQLARREADLFTAWAGLDHLARTHIPQGGSR
jgi:outer membrane protein TolC